MSHIVEQTTFVPHGVVFLCDPTAVIDVPSDTGAGPVQATVNCASFWTRHEADGPTAFALSDKYERQDCELVFEGSLSAPGRKLGFSTSSGERIIDVDLNAEIAEVAVYSNDPSEPTKLFCVVNAVRP